MEQLQPRLAQAERLAKLEIQLAAREAECNIKVSARAGRDCIGVLHVVTTSLHNLCMLNKVKATSLLDITALEQPGSAPQHTVKLTLLQLEPHTASVCCTLTV